MCWLDSAWTDGLPIQDILRGEVNAWQNQRNRDVIHMLGAIDLDDHLSLWSLEVHDVVADRLLSVKLD